jgi:hypothetical protein
MTKLTQTRSSGITTTAPQHLVQSYWSKLKEIEYGPTFNLYAKQEVVNGCTASYIVHFKVFVFLL